SNVCGQPRMACPEAGAAFACIAPRALELMPTNHMDLTWDGVAGRYDSGAGCLDRFMASGVLTATGCWGDAPAAMDDQHVTNKRCKSVMFTVGRDHDIRIDATE